MQAPQPAKVGVSRPGPRDAVLAVGMKVAGTKVAETKAAETETVEREAVAAKAAQLGAWAAFRARAPRTPAPGPIRYRALPPIRQRARDQTRRFVTPAVQASRQVKDHCVGAWAAARVLHLPGPRGRTVEDLRRAAPQRA